MNQPNPNDKPQNHAHFPSLNKAKSTVNPSDLFLKIKSPSLLTNNKNKGSPQENKKQTTFSSPLLSPQRRKSTITYQVCEGDTYESIASKFNISTNWLIRQNMKQILDPDFTLSKDIKFNVTSPSKSMIKPLDCVFIKNENDSDSNSNDFEKGKPGVAYIIIFENSLDFVPYNVNKTDKPFHIPLTSISEDVVVFTPKSQRGKIKKSSQDSKESTNQDEPENSLEIPIENNQNTTELAPQITESLVENSNENPTEKNEETLNQAENVSENIAIEKNEETTNQTENVSENIAIEKNEETLNQAENVSENIAIEKNEETTNQAENASENIAIEKNEETTNQTENQVQEQSNIIINESITQTPQKDESPQNENENENCALDANENLVDQTTENQSNAIIDQTVQLPPKESSELPNQNKETPDPTAEKIQPQSSQNLPENEKNRILVVRYKTKKNDQTQMNTLYFRVQKEAGNAFSASLLKAIKEAKEKLKAKKMVQIPAPQSLPSQRPHISGSTSSPLGFFQSIFSSIKDTFSHLNDPETANDNDEKEKDQQSPLKPPKSNLYRRSFSEKTINFSLFDQKDKNKNDANKDDSLKPRRNSTNSDMSSPAQPNRKVLAASVLMQIKINDGPSAIFERNEEIDELRAKLPYRMKNYDWSLIYRLSRDGSSFTTFFNYTKNSGPVVFIISTSTKERIGAFIPTGFKYSSRYYGSGEAFVFRFVKQQKKNEVNENEGDKNKKEKNENKDQPKVNKNEETKEENCNESKTDFNEEKKEENKADNNEEKKDENKADNNEEKKDENKTNNEEKTNEENNNENKAVRNEEKKEENNDESNSKEIKKDAGDDKKQSEKDESNSFAHIEAFKWTPGTKTNFMMSEKDTIIIGIGDDKDSYNKSDIEAINSSHGHMSGPAIWIGEDLQYASSSPCATFSSPQLTKKNYFYVYDIEIWKIGFFTNK